MVFNYTHRSGTFAILAAFSRRSNWKIMERTNIEKETIFKATRSSGAGGQHVNKVATRVELSFDIANSQLFTVEQKEVLHKNLRSWLTKDGLLLVSCDETRSQSVNRQRAMDKLEQLLQKGLQVPKRRKKTKVSLESMRQRLEIKRRQSDKKASRRRLTKPYDQD